MRLIDADALIVKLENDTAHPPELVYEHIIFGYFIRLLKAAPTVDAKHQNMERGSKYEVVR